MMMRLFAVPGLVALAVCPAFAQSTLTGPTLGMFFDPQAQAIRPIWGIPGSATAGQPMNLGFAITTGLISPAQDYALVVSPRGDARGAVRSSASPLLATDAHNAGIPFPRSRKSTSIVTFTPSGPSVTQVAGVAGAPDRTWMSPGGKSAALYYRISKSAEILTNLPSAGEVSRRVDLSTLPNAPDVMAISDDGSLLLVGVRENPDGSASRGEVFVFTPDAAAPRAIASVQHVSAIAFVGQSHDALVTDDVANSVVLISDVANGANVAWTFSSQQLPAPDSVRASSDRQSFLVGSSSNGIVAILDRAGSNAVVVACGCAPAELRPLNGSSTYQITEPANGLFWVLDGQLSNPRVFFVPIPSDSNQRSGTSTVAGEDDQP